jgi:hypothetical protein
VFHTHADIVDLDIALNITANCHADFIQLESLYDDPVNEQSQFSHVQPRSSAAICGSKPH